MDDLGEVVPLRIKEGNWIIIIRYRCSFAINQVEWYKLIR